MNTKETKVEHKEKLTMIITVGSITVICLILLAVLNFLSYTSDEPMDKVSYDTGYKSCLIDMIEVMMESNGNDVEMGKFILDKSKELK